MSALLLYIHGFISSPQSQKARDTEHYILEQQLPVEFLAPQIPHYPAQAFSLLTDLIERNSGKKIGMDGSSMGGFYATALAERFGLRAVVVNPAVRPARLIERYLGENYNPYTDETFVLEKQHIHELQELTIDELSAPKNIFLLAQAGDETLDYRDAVEYYRQCRQNIEADGNHRFEGFDRHLHDIFGFLQFTPN